MPAPDKSSADGKAVEKKTSGVGKRARWLALAGGLLLLWVGWWVVEWFRLPAAAAGAVKYAALAQLNKHEGGVASLAFAHHRSWFPLPRERYVVISGGRQKWVNLWDVAAPEEPKQTLMLESEVAGAVAVSADGARLASGSDALHVVGLFGLSGGEISVSKSAAECQKEKNATAGRGDKQTGYIDVAEWNKGILVGKGCVLPQTGNEASQFRLFANVRAVAFSPDGKLLAGIGKTSEMENARVTLWNRASGKEVALNPQNKDQEIRPPMAFSSDSKLFATGGRLKIGNRTETGVLLWDLSGRAVEALIGRVRTGGDAALALAFSPDGKWLASGCDSNHFCLWEVAGMVKINKAQVADKPSARFWTDPDRRVTAKLATLAFSSDGRFLATVGEGMNKVYLWSVEDGRWVLKDSFEHNYNAPITAIAFSDDARLLAIGCASGIVTLWQQTAAR
jgi:WD40 repeat protein